MKTTGYIKIFRSIEDWEWASDPTMYYFWVRLLLMVNWEDRMCQGELVERGSILTSLSKLANDMHLTIKQVRTCLDKLSKGTSNGTQVDIVRAHRGTKVTICNYESYQGEEKSKGTTKGTMKGTQKGELRASSLFSPTSSSSLPSPTPPSNVLSSSSNSLPSYEKEGRSAPLISPQGENQQPQQFSQKFLDVWSVLTKQPKWKGKTDGALNLTLKKLRAFDETFAIKLMEDAIEHNWQGCVFKETEARYQEWLSEQNKKKQFDDASQQAKANAIKAKRIEEEKQRKLRAEIEQAKADGSFIPSFGKPFQESDEEHRKRVMAQAAAILAGNN
jgi:hypothetical protein